MKRLITGIIVLFIVAGGLVASLPFFVSSDAVETRIVEHVRELAGRKILLRDTPRILFSPFLGIEISGVIFEDPNSAADDPPPVRMEKLRGQLDIMSALFGRVEIRRYQLVRPHFNFHTHADGSASWGVPKGKLWDVFLRARQAREQGGSEGETAQALPVSLGQFEIIDGTIEYTDEATGSAEIVTNVNARISWAQADAPLSIIGNCIWRDEAIEYTLRSEKPVTLMSGSNTPLSLGLKSGAFDMNFQGQANTLSDVHFSGKVQFSSPSIRRLAGFLGHELRSGSTLSEFSVEGDVKGTLRQLQLTNVAVAMDGNRGRGVLQITRAGDRNALINGTLAAEQLDFSPYVAALRQDVETAVSAGSGDRLLDLLDLDLRLSAPAAKVGPTVVTDFAASVTTHKSEAVLSIGNAVLFGGTLIGKVGYARTDEGSRVQVKAVHSGLDTAALSTALGLRRISLTGKADAEFQIRSQGTSNKSLIEKSWGDLTLTMKTGTVEGVNFNQLYEAAAQEGEGSEGLELAGRTPFQNLEGKIAFSGKSAWIRSIRLDDRQLSTQLAGRSALDMSAIALSVRMKRASEQASADASDESVDRMPGELPLFIGGSLETPLVTRIRVGSERDWQEGR